MKKTAILIFSILIIALIIGLFLFQRQKDISGKTILDVYTYTKALCNKSNYCQDYIITCQKNKTLDISPIAGAFTQKSQDWRDLRGNNSKDLCG